MNTPFSDYSKPAYYYRLFHEGKRFEDVPFDEIQKRVDDQSFRGAEVRLGNTKFYLPKGHTKIDVLVNDNHDMYGCYLTTSPVDPLADVW